MKANIINWERVPKGNDIELLSLYYSFLSISELLVGGAAVESLRLKGGDQNQVSEEGFREYIKGLVSIKWNEKELTKQQIQSLNKLSNYLKSSHKQEEQPIVKGGISIGELIKKHTVVEKKN